MLPVILLAQFVIPLSIAGTAVGLPAISDDLGASATPLQWVVNGFNVVFAVCTVLWGGAADRIGYGRAFRCGVALVLIGSVVSALSPSLLVLDVARAVAGIGAGAVITGATATLSRVYEGQARAKAFAAFGTVNGLGLAAGPGVSGLLIALVGWRGVFAAQVVLLAVALAGSFALPSARSAPATRGALLDVGLLRHPGFLAMVLIPVAGAVGFVTVLTYLPAALQAVHGSSAGAAGATMLFMTVPVLLAPSCVQLITQRSRRIGTAAICLFALACLVVAPLGLLLLRPDRSTAFIVIPMIMAGLGFGLPLGIVDGVALSFVPAERSGTAAGLLNFFRIGSEAIFVALYSAALAALIRAQPHTDGIADQVAAGHPGHPWIYMRALAPVLIALSVLALTLLAAFIPLYRRATHTSAPSET